MKGKAKFKLVGGDPVMLCSHCSIIIKYFKHFTEDEKLAAKGSLKIAPQFCDECEEKMNKYE